MKKPIIFTIISISFLINGCAMSSPPMPTTDGAYIISSAAAPVRGGSAGATTYAYQQASLFCAQKGATAILVDNNERDVQQSSFYADNRSAAGGSFVAGRAQIKFVCK